MIAIVDYGMGNLRAILNRFERLGAKAVITSDSATIESADKLILPGVGNFAAGIQNIDKMGLRPILSKLALQKKTPILGICLGMQLLTTHSEEGNVNGLGYIPSTTIKFPVSNLKIPHMGWNTIKITRPSLLLSDIPDNSRFYFVHSYHLTQSPATIASTNYILDFPSIVQQDNIFGVQFHPEKSHFEGYNILKNFAERI